jgi:ligand-binding sensor domain-containing protein
MERRFENFTTKDGLVRNKVTAVYTTSDGLLWVGTFGGGVAIYDGTVWTSLDTRDGLANNVVQGICSDADGKLWFAAQGGITRYQRSDSLGRFPLEC